jgi:proteasome lid subunit RPN8/RPN11
MSIKVLRFATCQMRLVNNHARGAMPNEAVGILGGHSDGRVVKVIPLPNRALDRFSFYADPYAQYCAEKDITANGLEIIGIYHSHPNGAAALSADDLVFASPWKCAHMVVAVCSVGTPIVKAYNLHRGKPSEIQIVVKPRVNGSQQ